MKDIDEKELEEINGGEAQTAPPGLLSGAPVGGTGGSGEDEKDEDKTLGDNQGGNVIPT